MKSPKRVVEVGLSSTFIAKNRCKHCSSTLSHTFLYANGLKHIDVNVINSMYRDYYKRETPTNSNTLIAHKVGITSHTFAQNIFSWKMHKGYSPKLHKSGSEPIEYIDGISCDCGFSFFIFNQTSGKKRPEIKNRKARNRFIIH